LDDHTFPHELESHSRRQALFDNERERHEREISKARNRLVSLGKRIVFIVMLAAILLLIFRGQWRLTFWDFAILSLCVFIPHSVLLLEILAKLIESRRNLRGWEKIMEACAEAYTIDKSDL
jgi:hypothetical protein